jgi:transcriptional regulator with XRE-family HTH domain
MQYKKRTSTESEAMKKTKKKTKLPFSEQLKELIEGADMSRYRIAKDSGVPQSTLSSFVKGRRALSLMNIDRICELLDLELVPRKSTSTK